MLVSRQRDAEQNHWNFQKTSSSSRMSTNFDPPLSTQPDWQGQYSSFLPPGDNIFGQSYDHHVSSSSSNNTQASAQPRSAGTENNGLDLDGKRESDGLSSPLSHRRSLGPLGLCQKPSTPISEHPEASSQGEQYSHKAPESVSGHEESLMSTDAQRLSLGSHPLSSGASSGQGQEAQAPQNLSGHHSSGNQGGSDDQGASKEEEDDVLDDEDMMEGDGDGEGATSQPQTTAERTAQRRKMKRFRLTHQQTRFLMSEFAKQPHPDAAHRERLSREIPGLSPRQVQVWFQNRRAKIKRLTADDRDRMIKMRAVPDDFDNVQALHSPYGAVHGLGAPMSSPVDFSGSGYPDHLMRPLMVDVRRPDGGEEHLSPTGLTPAFGSIGFTQSATMSTPDILSPLSPPSNDRYGYSSHSHLSSPLSAGGPRTSNPFARHSSSLDSGLQIHGHHHNQQQQHRQGIRPLQPLHLREMSRSRSDSLQSPLRSGMSWKGDSIDYTAYHHGGGQSPQIGGRGQSIYQSESLNSTATTLGGYEPSTYSGSTVQSPTHMSYPSFQSSSLQPNAQARPNRLRAATASLPLGLDLRTQFPRQSSTLQPSSSSSGHHSPSHARNPSGGSHHLGGGSGGVTSSTTSYSASFPSAPLTAPIDFSIPRTPGGGFRSSGQDYSMSQMSAPIAPPNDFSQAFQASMGSGGAGTGSSSSARTTLRDTFGSNSGAGGSGESGTSGVGGGSNTASTDHHHHHHHRSDDYHSTSSSHQDGGGLKRKHSFTLPTGVSTSGPGTTLYGSAT